MRTVVLKYLLPHIVVLLEELAVVLPLLHHILQNTVLRDTHVAEALLAVGDSIEVAMAAAEYAPASPCYVELDDVGGHIRANGADSALKRFDAFFEFGVLGEQASILDMGSVCSGMAAVARGKKADVVVVNPRSN